MRRNRQQMLVGDQIFELVVDSRLVLLQSHIVHLVIAVAEKSIMSRTQNNIFVFLPVQHYHPKSFEFGRLFVWILINDLFGYRSPEAAFG